MKLKKCPICNCEIRLYVPNNYKNNITSKFKNITLNNYITRCKISCEDCYLSLENEDLDKLIKNWNSLKCNK